MDMQTVKSNRVVQLKKKKKRKTKETQRERDFSNRVASSLDLS